ncbi:hypothetical protein [uncultured Christiangramia sp.]|uniref:LVIVD repeat-containing protein n=1 Tax=Christiangramia sp. 3-2217-3z TaxID=3417564 RepID=UPI00263796B2|nr:hypothetical protein [uncultured Christiangramia sp.]
MKNLLFVLLLSPLFLFTSCEEDSDDGFTTVAVPVTQSIADFRASVEIQAPREIKESGKIYAWQNYIFINDKNEGVHIINNTDPFNPVKVQFLKIPRNTDVAIRNNMLYANNGMDLVVFDLSDMNAIKEAGRVKDIFPNYYRNPPPGQVSFVDFENFDYNTEVIIGYITESRKIEYARGDLVNEPFFSEADGGGSGTGGSMARFTINDELLYIAEESELSVVDISNPSNPVELSSEYAGWNIETIFHYQDHLYLGSATGMYIYDLENPESPQQVSFLQHVLGCDPVVVKDNYAYVTIRGGNNCGQNFNQLDVVDVSDKNNPRIVSSYEMNNPFGLGVKDDWLFVCDGDEGLKIFDTKNTPDLSLVDQFTNINTYDVIPLDDKLLMIGDNTLSQYSYKGNEVNLISTFSLN